MQQALLKNKSGERTVRVEQVGNQVIVDGKDIYGELTFQQVIESANEHGYYIEEIGQQ